MGNRYSRYSSGNCYWRFTFETMVVQSKDDNSQEIIIA